MTTSGMNTNDGCRSAISSSLISALAIMSTEIEEHDSQLGRRADRLEGDRVDAEVPELLEPLERCPGIGMMPRMADSAA